MLRHGAHPEVGDSARSLGVRVPGDIAAPGGQVRPGTGGMSVAPSWRDLPPHRIPKRLAHLVPDAAGRGDLACWCSGDGPFLDSPLTALLHLRSDRSNHGLVEPSGTMTLEAYRAALASTRESWRIDEA